MKTYTDFEQSKKLAEILPIESADSYYYYNCFVDDYKIFPTIIEEDDHFKLFPRDIPCWSLAMLLDIYPMIVGRDMGMYCCWQNSKHLCSRHYDNPIDACYEMILKLKEKNLL